MGMAMEKVSPIFWRSPKSKEFQIAQAEREDITAGELIEEWGRSKQDLEELDELTGLANQQTGVAAMALREAMCVPKNAYRN